MPTLSRDAQKTVGCGLDVMSEKWPRLFMGMVHHRTTKGTRMIFHDKPWLTPIYQDNAHNKVIIKCSQVHMTEHALCAMYDYANRGKRGMYILPSKEHRKTFVADRINKMKDFSPLYDNAIKSGSEETDSNVYKTIFGTGWKFVGSNVKKDFFEFPCDVLFMDEFDELDQDNLLYSYDRVADCANPIIWKFGNPTRDNHGIHKEFMASDQKEWHVECGHCGKEQILDWYEHFVTPYHGTWRLQDPAGRPMCQDCQRPFDRLNTGRWIALNPGPHRASGYRISRLFTNKHKEPNDIIWLFKKFIDAQHNPTALQVFHNNYLGVTFENIDFKITKEVLARSVWKSEDIEFDPAIFRTVMGVDQGKHFTCVISMVWDGEVIDVHYANVDRWSDVKKLEEDWNVACTVIDAQGGGYADTRDFVREGIGNRWMCYYRPKDQIKGDKPYKLNYQSYVVETNRTECLDLMVKQLLDKKAHCKPDFEHNDNGEYVKQMMEPARKTDSNGRPIWTKGKDHFFHSSGYRYLAWRISGMTHSVALNAGWHVGKAAEDKQAQPRDHGNIGAPTEPKKETTKRRSWHL